MLKYIKEYEILDNNKTRLIIEACEKILQTFKNKNSIQFVYNIHFLSNELRVDIYYNLTYPELRELDPEVLEQLKASPIKNTKTDKRWVTLHTLKDLIKELNYIEYI